MLRIDDLNENKVLRITVSGKLTKSDYALFLPDIEKLLGEHGTLRFYIQLVGFSGFEAGALWEDIKFDVRNKEKFGKIAIVGEKKWEEWGTKFSKLFFGSEIRFFYEDQSDSAWEWINA